MDLIKKIVWLFFIKQSYSKCTKLKLVDKVLIIFLHYIKNRCPGYLSWGRRFYKFDLFDKTIILRIKVLFNIKKLMLKK